MNAGKSRIFLPYSYNIVDTNILLIVHILSCSRKDPLKFLFVCLIQQVNVLFVVVFHEI